MSPEVPSKRTARTLATMVDSGLIGYRHFTPWADALVMALEAPPHWLLELCTTRYQPSAARLLHDYAASPPFESFDESEQTDEYVACLLLRHQRGEISWATFLQEAGRKLDGANGRRHCEDIYALLTELETHEYSKDLEHAQRAAMEREFRPALERVQPLYAMFTESFRRTVAR